MFDLVSDDDNPNLNDSRRGPFVENWGPLKGVESKGKRIPSEGPHDMVGKGPHILRHTGCQYPCDGVTTQMDHNVVTSGGSPVPLKVPPEGSTPLRPRQLVVPSYVRLPLT